MSRMSEPNKSGLRTGRTQRVVTTGTWPVSPSSHSIVIGLLPKYCQSNWILCSAQLLAMIMVPANTGRADTLPITVRSLSHGLICDEVTQVIDALLSRTGTSLTPIGPLQSKLGQAHRKWGLQLCRYDSKGWGLVCAGEGLQRSPGRCCGPGTLPGPHSSLTSTFFNPSSPPKQALPGLSKALLFPQAGKIHHRNDPFFNYGSRQHSYIMKQVTQKKELPPTLLGEAAQPGDSQSCPNYGPG